MDPNEALRLIRSYIAQMRVEDTPPGGIGTSPTFVQHARDLAETVEGLDQWLTKNGLLPDEWAPLFEGGFSEPSCTEDHS